MKLSHRRKKANKHGIPQREYAAKHARKWRQHQRRLRGFARRQHRQFDALLRPLVRKAALAALMHGVCANPRLVAPDPTLRPDCSEVKVTRLALGIQWASMMAKPVPTPPPEPETKPSVWQRVKARVSRWFEKPKMTENMQL